MSDQNLSALQPCVNHSLVIFSAAKGAAPVSGRRLARNPVPLLLRPLLHSLLWVWGQEHRPARAPDRGLSERDTFSYREKALRSEVRAVSCLTSCACDQADPGYRRIQGGLSQ